jgi:hypothetical protein
MPYQLTAAKQTGDLDAGTYGEVKISTLQWIESQNRVTFSWEYGNTVDSAWVSGVARPVGDEGSATISGSDFDTLKSTHASNDGELTWDAIARCLYTWLNDNGKIPDGSVV